MIVLALRVRTCTAMHQQLHSHSRCKSWYPEWHPCKYAMTVADTRSFVEWPCVVLVIQQFSENPNQAALQDQQHLRPVNVQAKPHAQPAVLKQESAAALK